ncbi:hypothetical protein K2173_026392 [Erythroxylum novogranatense]|uniref:LysM domain-containing protein n=1 Tax=Erythroxylum novogranatense TaxID=1862640 RepID=A0AAV8SN64_9ROSI|nr:hypothetical protein K2173_026392 [Erythroxylum novogranatense]
MGNAASCAPSIISNGVVKVLLPDGILQVYTRPVKAAELMLENPGQFVCDSSSLKVGQRIHGLSADEELERRQLYFLLPMDMLYSVLTQEEMTTLTSKTTKTLKQTHFGKIFPVLSETFCIFPSDSKAMVSMATEPEPVERYSKQKSWKPALETIFEIPGRQVSMTII